MSSEIVWENKNSESAPSRPVVRQSAKVTDADRIVPLHAAGCHDMNAAHHGGLENIDPDGTRPTTPVERGGMTYQSMGLLVQALDRAGCHERRIETIPRTAARASSSSPRRAETPSAAQLPKADIDAVWHRAIAQPATTRISNCCTRQRSATQPPVAMTAVNQGVVAEHFLDRAAQRLGEVQSTRRRRRGRRRERLA